MPPRSEAGQARGAAVSLSVSVLGIARHTAIAAIGLALIGFGARPAAAQITFGSPGDPPHIALGAGAFDITPSNHRDSHTAAEFRGEYRFGDMFWLVSPFVGVQGTSDGAFYGYGGFGVDVNFSPNLVLTPNVAAGYFAPGSGTRLGYPLEFRSGAELAWRFADTSRLGVAVHHISNAGLGKHNPGEQEILLMYSFPFR
jgi:lipid A 3-O-deacylase